MICCSQGAPCFARIFAYPNLNASAIMASRSFYKSDSVSFSWNKKGVVFLCTEIRRDVVSTGSAVLVITTTEVDKTGASYYGEQGLHYLSAHGESNMVQLSTLLHMTFTLSECIGNALLVLCVFSCR